MPEKDREGQRRTEKGRERSCLALIIEKVLCQISRSVSKIMSRETIQSCQSSVMSVSKDHHLMHKEESPCVITV